jgi:hypothetical protein
MAQRVEVACGQRLPLPLEICFLAGKPPKTPVAEMGSYFVTRRSSLVVRRLYLVARALRGADGRWLIADSLFRITVFSA